MKIFIDTLDINDIERYNRMGIIVGVTTNPTFMKKWGFKDTEDMIKQIRTVMPTGEIHVEVFKLSTREIIDEAEYLNEKYSELVFKIPFTYWGLRAVKKLESNDIKCNVHLIFSVNQAIMADAVGATYICPLVGRLDDIGADGIHLIEQLNETWINANIMVSSVRHPHHVQQAAMHKFVEAITIPPAVLDKMLYHPLTEKGIEQFESDA